jgi:tyrosyl-tRNA synthetase
MTSATESTTQQTAMSAPEQARAEGRNPLDYLRERGFVQDVTDEEGLKRAFADGVVTVYWGVDPTATSLHVGNMVSIMLLASLQRFGHRPIALGGGGTALVGDPSGRTSSRELIALEDLERNLAGILPQLRRYLDFDGGRFGDNPPALLLNNADWLQDLKYIPFLRDIGRHFSVNEMLAAETYRTRLESTGLNFVEFNYRIVQAYDFLHLYRTFGCALQVGGSDQWGNITAGVELVRKADGGKVYAFVTPLILTATGEKMGKTSSGARPWLDPNLTSPYDYYQYWVNTDDSLVATYLRLFTFLPEERIAALTWAQGAALREAKQVLAFEATALAHGAAAAEQARDAAQALFSSGRSVALDDPNVPTTDIPRADIDSGLTLAEAFIRADLAKSRGDARRLAQQGGLSVDEERVSDVDVPFGDVVSDREAVLLRAGRKRFRRVLVR